MNKYQFFNKKIINVITRRKFLVTSLITSVIASCMGRSSAQKITTDTQGLIAEEVMIPLEEGQLPAYYAMPESGDNFPVIMVVHEIFGLTDYIKDICHRLAKLGYYAIAPNLYFRIKNFDQLKEIPELAEAVFSQVSDQQVFADLDSTVNWIAKTGQGNPDQIGITGFCWGGRIVWLYAAHNPKLKAGVAWYGRLVGDTNPMNPQQPIDIAASLKVPVLGLYGGQDTLIPMETVEQMQQVLKTGNSNWEIIIYPDAPHGFFADYRPSYRPDDAEDAWKRLQAWFNKHK